MKLLYFFIGLSLSILCQREVLAQEDFDSLFQQAESVKSADPKQFTELLNQLNLSTAALSDVQYKKLAYLNAYSLSFSGNLKQGIEEYKKVVEGQLIDSVQIKAAMSIVNNSALTEQWETGLVYANWLLEHLDAIEDDAILETVYYGIAFLYNTLGQYQSGLGYSQKLLSINATPRGQCMGHITLMEATQRLGQMAQNQQTAQRGIEICEQAGEFLGTALIKLFLAEYLATTDNPSLAIDAIESPLEQIRKINYSPILAAYHITLAEAYFNLGNSTQAQKYAELVLSSAVRDYKLPRVKALDILYKIARDRGDYALALDYLEKHSNSERAYWNSVRVREFAVQRVNLETLEKNNQIIMLNQQNSLLKTQNELTLQQAQNNRLALALTSVLLILLFLWLYRSRKIQVRLRKLAQTDELTGINNRHYFNETAEQLIRQGQTQQHDLCFVLFDLDHFKKINDRYGHQIGDWALKHSVLEAQKVCRSMDVIGRMGGEEFAILLPGCSIEEGLRIAEICRKAIERIDTSPTGHKFIVTASFGVADTSLCGYNLDRLFAGADTALYSSKEHGRNQVYQLDPKDVVMGI